MSIGDFMPYYKQPDRIATVQEALTQHNVDDLKKLAAFVPGDKIPTRKNDLVEYILPHLQGASLKNLWAQCDQVQQAAIAETVHSATDKYQKIKFTNKYGGSPKWGASSGYSYNTNPTVLGLFFYYYTMPVELKQRLKAFVPEPEPARITSHETIPSVLTDNKTESDFGNKQSNNVEMPLQMRETEQVARRELISMLRLVDLGKVAISDKTLYPTGATLNNITTILEEGDYYSEWKTERSTQGYKYDYPIGHIRPFGWVMILQVGKLVEVNGKQLALTKAGQKALNEPAEKTLQTLWKNWQKNTLLDELRRIEGIKGQTGKGKSSLTALSGRRSPIAAALKECPVGQWVKFSELCRYLRAAEHDLLVSRNLDHLTISGSSGSNYESNFLTVEARYLACVLFEYAATMGLIDVSFLHPDDGFVNFTQSKDRYYYSHEPLSRYDGLTYFRLTPLGAYILGITDQYIPQVLPQKQILQISSNLEVVAIEQLSRTDRLVLDSCLQPISDSVWKLDSGKLLDAVSQGRNINELKDFLVANSGADLPKTVVKVLTDLQARTSSLQDLGTARLVRCADSALAIVIANDARTKAFCFLADQPAAMTAGKPCYLVVPIATEVKFHNALKKIGYCL
jgi:hypothetical protein